MTRSLPILVAVALAAATMPCEAAATDTTADVEALRTLAKKIEAVPPVDIGYCQYTYPAFNTELEGLQQSVASSRFHRLLEHHGIELAAPQGGPAEPTQAQCLDALDAVRTRINQHAELIERASALLPPAAPDED